MEKIIFKLCLGQKIHRCPKVPENFEALIAAIKSTFKEELPEKYSLSYVDQEGDRVLIHAEDDFKSMMEAFGPEVRSIKIFVAPEDQDEIPEGMLGDKSTISNASSTFQVLLNKKEVPVQEKQVEEPEKKIEISEPSPVSKKKEIAQQVDPKLEIAMIQSKKKPEIQEEVKVEEPVIVKDFDDQDLSKKSNLRAFIIQTIEEAMPQIMAQMAKKEQDEKKKKGENAVMKGIMNIANQISDKVEKIVIGEKESLNGKIRKLEKMIPDHVTTMDEQVYAVLTIKNTGSEAFPQTTFLQNVGGVYGDIVKIPALEPGKKFKTTVVLKGPKKAGNYITKWTLAYVDQRNVTKQFGETFEIKFSIAEKKYSKEVQAKANVLKELLPDTPLTTFLELISKDPSKSIEALVEEVLSNPSN